MPRDEERGDNCLNSDDDLESEGSAHSSDNDFIDDEGTFVCSDGTTVCTAEIERGRRRCLECHNRYWGDEAPNVCRCEDWATCEHTDGFECDACFYYKETWPPEQDWKSKCNCDTWYDDPACASCTFATYKAIKRGEQESQISHENHIDSDVAHPSTEENGATNPVPNEETVRRGRAQRPRLFTPESSEDYRRARQARIAIDQRRVQTGYRTATPVGVQRNVNSTIADEGSTVGHQSQVPEADGGIRTITGGVDALAIEPCDGTREPGKRLGKKTFRLAARRLLVTYAQTRDSWDAQLAIQLFEDLGARLRCGRELHADGGTHYHFFVDFERKFETENPRRFDVAGAHPNILVVWKTPHHAWDYVGKDGDVVYDTTERPPVESRKHDRDEAYRHVLAARTEDEFYSRLQETDPRALIISASSVESCCKRLCSEANREIFERVPGLSFAWRAFPSVTKWILGNVPGGAQSIRLLEGDDPFTQEDEEELIAELPPRVEGGRRHSLILWGPTKHGKTDLARHIGRHFHAGNDWSLDEILSIGLDNIDYGILDDIDWDHDLLKGSRYKAWLGCQDHFICSDKYTRKYSMKWGRPIIFLTNNDPVEGLKTREYDWIQRNCVIQEINEGQHIARRPNIFVRTVMSQPQEAEAST